MNPFKKKPKKAKAVPKTRAGRSFDEAVGGLDRSRAKPKAVKRGES